MSNAEFSISREDFETILLFTDFMLRNNYRPDIRKVHWWLSKIKYEMEKYENKGCDAVVELCQEVITASYTKYKHGKAITQAMTKFTNAVNEVVSDEVVNSI